MDGGLLYTICIYHPDEMNHIWDDAIRGIVDLHDHLLPNYKTPYDSQLKQSSMATSSTNEMHPFENKNDAKHNDVYAILI